jgi:hypothetical protein
VWNIQQTKGNWLPLCGKKKDFPFAKGSILMGFVSEEGTALPQKCFSRVGVRGRAQLREVLLTRATPEQNRPKLNFLLVRCA